MLTRTIVIFTPSTIVWKNMLGNTVKSVQFKPGEVIVENNKVFVDGKKVLSLWMFNTNTAKTSAYFSGLKQQDE